MGSWLQSLLNCGSCSLCVVQRQATTSSGQRAARQFAVLLMQAMLQACTARLELPCMCALRKVGHLHALPQRQLLCAAPEVTAFTCPCCNCEQCPCFIIGP